MNETIIYGGQEYDNSPDWTEAAKMIQEEAKKAKTALEGPIMPAERIYAEAVEALSAALSAYEDIFTGPKGEKAMVKAGGVIIFPLSASGLDEVDEKTVLKIFGGYEGMRKMAQEINEVIYRIIE